VLDSSGGPDPGALDFQGQQQLDLIQLVADAGIARIVGVVAFDMRIQHARQPDQQDVGIAVGRMAQQATDEQRRAVATWVLDNAGDLAALALQVERLWPELVAFAVAEDEARQE